MRTLLIANALMVNEGSVQHASLLIKGEKIAEIWIGEHIVPAGCDEVIDATGCYLLPGVIDEHVHFRDPGLAHKADIMSESRAAVAGGVTSIMDMPNTMPQTTTLEAWEQKCRLMEEKCTVNYACYFGATNSNYELFKQLDSHRVCGIKLFMGSSTGNMLVDNELSLRQIFANTDLLICAHCEDQKVISDNVERYKQEYGSSLPVEMHSSIRSDEACFRSSHTAVELASAYGARLHILHVSTERELALFHSASLSQKKITAEVCVPHLLYTVADYKRLGTRIKCNPSIKSEQDRAALRHAVCSGLIDTIATDHAPHLLSDKQGDALTATSGMPMVQFSLVSMLALVDENVFTLPLVVEKMSHAPARLYGVQGRGYLRKGYQADMVLVRPNAAWTVTTDCIESKCKWSPLEGTTFNWRVEKTFVNGQMVYNQGAIAEDFHGQPLYFDKKS